MRITNFPLFIALTFVGSTEAQNTVVHTTRLCLPPVIYAVPGMRTEIQFANAIFPRDLSERLEVKPRFTRGEADGERWVFTPEDVDVGDHQFDLSVRHPGKNDPIARAETTIRVVPSGAGDGRNISLLLVGDSLTHASHYPNELGRLLSLPGNPSTIFLGTHHPPAARENIFHEGYGGWTWNRFATKFERDSHERGKRGNSPFLFPDIEGEARLDFGRYCEEKLEGRRPEFIIVLLGINDCFHADPSDVDAIEARIDRMLENAEVVIAAFRLGAPETEIGICLTTPGNSRDGAFEANYRGRYTRRGWKTIQFRLVERQLEYFRNREHEKLFIVPTSLHLDPTHGYPEDNGVHPNLAGYRQIAADLFAWVKWRLSEGE